MQGLFNICSKPLRNTPHFNCSSEFAQVLQSQLFTAQKTTTSVLQNKLSRPENAAEHLTSFFVSCNGFSLFLFRITYKKGDVGSYFIHVS